jgi:ribosomal protein S18 acetylase RimI-like enzyme
MTLTYRTARPDDAAASSSIITAALNDLAARRGTPSLSAPEGHAAPVLQHLIETDGDRFWVAVEGERVVAFGSGWQRGALSYCGGLFVLPEWQGRGVGRRLFELALAGLPGAGGVAALTSSAGNPVSNGLYARHGIYPMFALLAMTGSAPAAAALAAAGATGDGEGSAEAEDSGLAVKRLDEGDLEDLQEIDDAVLGADRTVDHRWHLGARRNTGWLLCRDGHAAGYAYLGGDGTEGEGFVGPVAALGAEDQVPLIGLALSELRSRGVDEATLLVPGANIVAQRLLWNAGFRFTEATGLLCMSRPFGRFDRYLLSGDALM